MTAFWIDTIGYVAQALFSARLLVQWIRSEKAGRVLSPTIFWQLSLIASFLLIVYGIFEMDLVIIGGQFLSYFIYMRNLKFKNAWQYIPKWFKFLSFIFPFIALFIVLFSQEYSWKRILHHNPIDLLFLWGGLGQLVFTMRFVYQWYVSEKLHKSILPGGFWIISLIGSVMIITYAIYQDLYPIILGQIFGVIIYSRNLMLHLKKRKLLKKL